MKTLKFIALFATCLLTVAYTLPGAPASPMGTYGVCDSGLTLADGRTIALTLNEDHTFHYMDGTNPKAAVDVKGSWELDGNTVVLRTAASQNTVFEKWTMDKDTDCLRSRKGFLFTRLCHLK